MTFINTSARSLCPKINSLIDPIEELDAAFAVVTETWLADGATLEDKQDLLLGTGLLLLCKNRKPDDRGMSYGGVGLFFREELCNFKQLSMNNSHNYEILTAVGSIQGLSRKIALLGCYMPPNYTVAKARSCLGYIEKMVIEMKRRLRAPIIVVTGDFNQWPIEEALQEFRDLSETSAGPTTGTRTIDRTFTNLDKIIESNMLNPLQTDHDEQDRRQLESDHRIFYLTPTIRRNDKYKWLNYSYRYNNEDSAKKFGEWLLQKDWAALPVMRRLNFTRRK